ncbi:sensor histidine kinase [Kitasatospora sp. NPDC056138]|uniref:sensor histidine kinase n=1 Tax=Kitasatospora sp. NPDC056138 TaxID=3345724 RepID=UPI0035DACB5F
MRLSAERDRHIGDMTWRRQAAAPTLGTVGGAAAGVTGLVCGVGPRDTAPAAFAVALLLWLAAGWPRTRTRVGPTAVLAGLSLATTALGLLPGETGGHEGAIVRFSTTGGLLLLLAATVRWAPAHRVRPVGALAGGAITLWIVPYLGGVTLPEGIAACAFWSLAATGAAAFGGYPRWVEQRRRTAVATARRDQRLELARDLHDFVAHDVSGIVAQAQAALFVAGSDPAQAVPALERIEAAGLHALAAMDRMVQALHEGGDDGTTSAAAARGPVPGVRQLPELVDRFAASGQARARLDLAPGALDALSREAGSTAYRVVVEALTNIRRHASHATRVEVTLAPARTAQGQAAVEVRVVDDAGAARGGPLPSAGRFGRSRHRTVGGYGLIGLGERVRAAGGTFSAGPGPDGGGWQVLAVLPEGGAWPPGTGAEGAS